MEIKKELKRFWKWLWESESLWSYLVLILLIIIIIKLILFPFLSFAFQTSLPLAIVESSSMDHRIVKDDVGRFSLCGNFYEEKEGVNFDEYWQICGGWYEVNTNISKEDMKNFDFYNGFSKGDLIIVSGYKQPEIGNVIIFEGGRQYPIIHRVISLDPLSTKGDHNRDRLAEEKDIQENQVIGIAVGKIPWIGWPKVVFCEKLNLPGICY